MAFDFTLVTGLVGWLGAGGMYAMTEKKDSFNTGWVLLRGLWMLGTLLVCLGTFGYGWWWAFEHWGWLLGIAFGWIPALIVAVLAGALWPLVSLLVFMAMFYFDTLT